MAWFGSVGNQDLERYYPVSPTDAFAALVEVVGERFNLKESDDFAMTVHFSKGASAFTWGENFTAQVVPAEAGVNVKVAGVGKVGGQIQQAARIRKLVDQMFVELTARLRQRHSGKA
ncbi:hypothetical protein [Kutzneria sp. 744]|uniref:hypothetical protein n=1 Tax=Kutzneria sp. (strain 744) TaxID=345341 RepID=UPI0003EEC08E|nr:hypothetical protein [Kutzneria sp. 744]EWM14691.1 hypothetical protein KUTG_04995 [Kutzneria sp. 744]